MRCEHCGALQQPDGSGYCRVCAAPLAHDAGMVRLAPTPRPARPASGRSRRLTAVTLAAIGFLLLVCLTLAALTLGLTALIRWV
jgi:hypothetical protein